MAVVSREPWYDSDNPDRVARGFGGRLAVWVVAVLVFVAVVGGAVWGFRVLTSDIRGRGDAVVNKNTGVNRVQAQEQFERLHAEIAATDRKLAQLAADKATDPGTETQTRYSGAVNYCQSIVGQYNALARSYSAQDFRSFDLPARVDETDPTTDCKEAK